MSTVLVLIYFGCEILNHCKFKLFKMSSTNSTENHAVEEKYEDPQQQQQQKMPWPKAYVCVYWYQYNVCSYCLWWFCFRFRYRYNFWFY